MASKILSHVEEHVLIDAYHERDSNTTYIRNGSRGWLRPLDLGGRNGSHHSQTLAMLVALGFMQKINRSGHSSRPSYLYRVTDEGEAKAEEILQRKKFQTNG